MNINYSYSWNLNIIFGNKSLKETLETLLRMDNEIFHTEEDKEYLYKLVKDIRLYEELSKQIGKDIPDWKLELSPVMKDSLIPSKDKMNQKNFLGAYSRLVNKMNFNLSTDDKTMNVNKSYLEHLLSSSNISDERRKAYHALYEPYIQNQEILDHLIELMVRNNNDVNPLNQEINFLINSVPKNITYEEYLNVRFGNEIKLYNKAFSNNNLKLLSENEAIVIIIHCLKTKLNTKFERTIVNALSEGRFDILPKKGKYPGSFCLNLEGKGTFLLSNFYGDIDSLFNLMHEIGHYISFNMVENRDVLIVISEIHAIVCELILINQLIDENKSSSAYTIYLEYYLELYDEYIFSQLMIADFELQIYGGNNIKNFPLLFEDLLVKYYKSKIIDTDIEKFGYLRMPQLFKKFYTSTYPIAFFIAQYIVENLLPTNNNVYLEVMKNSNNFSKLDQLLELLGISINQDLVDFSFKKLDKILNEYKMFT